MKTKEISVHITLTIGLYYTTLIVPNILSFAETFLVIFFIKYIATFLLERLKRESLFMGSYFGSMNFYQQNSIKNNSKVKFSPWKTYYVRVLVSNQVTVVAFQPVQIAQA